MKKLLLLSLLTGLFFTPIKAQEYTPLLDTFNEWHFTTCYFGCLTDVYYTDGDTLVDGIPHKILDGYHYISRSFLLRENIPERKVYLTKVNENFNSEYLLYDFSLEEGDSIEMHNPITPFPPNGGYFKLDSIRLKPLVDGEEYRHFYLSPTESNTISTENAEWIEGIGSLSIINAPGGHPDINGVGHLSCFFKNGSPFYVNLDSIDGCEPVLSIFDVKKPMAEIEFRRGDHPNNYLFSGTQEVKWYGVFDITGKSITSEVLLEEQTQVNIDLEGYSSGLYLVVMRNAMHQEISFKLTVK